MAPILSVDLYRCIVEYYTQEDRRTLLSLMFTSRAFNYEAERILYRSFNNFSDITTQTLFLNRVISCPRVAKFVRSYKLFITFTIDSELLSEFLTLLHTAFLALVELKYLGFRTLGGSSAAQVLTGCTFQLEELDWDCSCDEHLLINFLSTQKSLQSFASCWDPSHIPPPPDIVPFLTSLRGRYGLIQAFLPGRKITNLDWIPDIDDPDPDMALLADSLANIHTMTFGGYFTRPNLSTIAQYLTQVTNLELRGVQADDLDCVHLMPNLEVFTISMRPVPGFLIPRNDPNAVVVKLFSGCAKLEIITIASKKHDFWPQDYRKWERKDFTAHNGEGIIPWTDIPYVVSEWKRFNLLQREILIPAHWVASPGCFPGHYCGGYDI
ncbi:uncharacterized protein BT62DRAFT_935355 [Guyanagaster necrorhizus]|uniref:Uncharacterized protein n=1 Tax=Guyanagaster necrorhizus TaxID=856835 RepID=A0A9P7VM25_9AGAR|nr:uncharacterized protein BT62DRAFT_935355 [Guyanagaster necrorhizus MCA 3950]KAG7443033.1 hypothetical protein BT62DRAFT_935355 [Guyanagaster necrorhizus MCA 3950]